MYYVIVSMNTVYTKSTFTVSALFHSINLHIGHTIS